MATTSVENATLSGISLSTGMRTMRGVEVARPGRASCGGTYSTVRKFAVIRIRPESREVLRPTANKDDNAGGVISAGTICPAQLAQCARLVTAPLRRGSIP